MSSDPSPESGSDEGPREWGHRLGWSFGLLSEEPFERSVALEQLEAAQQVCQNLQQRFYEVCDLLRPLTYQERLQEPLYRDSRQALEEAQLRVLPPRFWPWHDGDIRRWPGLTYLLLYLEWEAKFPEEWTQHSKAWGSKQALIRNLAVPDHDPAIRGRLTELVMTAVGRAHRCKDREYVRIARVIDGPDLRSRLAEATSSVNPWTRLHSGYVLWILDHPNTPSSRHVWKTWCAAQQLRTQRAPQL